MKWLKVKGLLFFSCWRKKAHEPGCVFISLGTRSFEHILRKVILYE